MTRLAAARLRATRQRRRRTAVTILMLAAGLVGYDLTRGGQPLNAWTNPSPPVSATDEAAGPGSVVAAAPTDAVAATPSVVRSAAGTFQVAAGSSAVVGRSGPVVHYQVAVEDGTGVDPAGFAAAVNTILGDPRSWIASGTFRLQRVAGTTPAQFTIYLASPVTSEAMCRDDWLETQQFTNCRLSDGRVIINSARWLTAVPNYGAPLADYQAYAINHEVGHQLGHGHELCPGPGQPAPVMQQQTLGLDGCVAYGWPYRDGVRYTGPPTSS